MTRYYAHPLFTIDLYDAIAIVGAVVVIGALVAFIIVLLGPNMDADGG